MSKKTGSILLIAFGTLFLLYNLNIIAANPWSLIWPGFIIWLGVDQLADSIRNRQMGKAESWEVIFWIFITFLGVYLLLPKFGMRIPTIPWKVIWPMIIIVFGLTKLFSNSRPIFKVNLEPKSDYEWQKEYRASFVGEFNRGPTSWVVEDMKIHQSIGSINLDLTNAIIPDREIQLDISGFIGDTNIYLPPNIPFKAECHLKAGEITVLDHSESGTQRYVNIKSSDYESATQKLNITVNWKLGDVNIRQIR